MAFRSLLKHPILYRGLLRPSYFVLGVYRVYIQRPPTFQFRGTTYRYFYHWYGLTYLIERAVEIPVFRELLKKHSGGRVLEVGNCLSHFSLSDHEVVDKYEIAPGVMNVDVVDFSAAQSYDLILSISTLEHVGWDEEPRDPDKTLRAIERLVEALAPGGEMLISWPLGHNTSMDAHFYEGRIRFTETACLKRLTHLSNLWTEVSAAEVADAQYGSPFRGGNAIVFGFVRKDDTGQVIGT